MSLSRFHLSASEWQPDQLTLMGDEAAHCARVLRRNVGDAIEIFDGQGRVATGAITGLSKSAVKVRVDELKQHESRGQEIHLLPAMIKAEPFEWLLEKATELGAASVRPVITARTVVHLSGEHLDKKLHKWQRHMIESAKQCHTPWVPALERPRAFTDLVSKLPAESTRLIPALSEHSRRLHEISFSAARPIFILIGPEGDFTDEEEAAAQEAGFQAITLGPLILRAETAAIATLAMVGHEVARQGAVKAGV
ncbi:MAG: 16S rRNA (uracil(1498)-N(3))-methyltransferase [Verrucomicrobiota bacterium]